MYERVPGVVGIVLGNRPSTPLEFWFSILDGKLVALDDVVVVSSEVPEIGEVKFYGVVTEMERYLEDSKYAVDSKLFREGKLPSISSWVAKVYVTRVEPEEIFVPPAPGDEVMLASESDVAKAFYFDSMERKVPIGLLPSGHIMYVNADFLDGTKGAHVSITGISGVATKTSFATFLLYSLFHMIPPNMKRFRYKGLVFNVKGEDLLYISHKNSKLRQEDAEMWRRLGVDVERAGGFKGVRIYSPPKPFSGEPEVSSALIDAKSYGWTLYQFASDKLLRFAFMDERTLSGNILSAIEHLADRLAILSERSSPPAIYVNGGALTNLDDLYELLRLDADSEPRARVLFRRDESPATIKAVLRRFERIKDELGRLIGPNLKPPELMGDGDLIVVDIHSLSSKAQGFVTGSVLYNLYSKRVEGGSREPVFFILIDELNKYAPSDGYTPLKDVLVDIAERGRSLGLILIGAQQTASQVESRILANCSLKVVGRMDSAEVQKPIYHYMSPITRQRATILKPGRMIVYQPDCPTPVLLRFPMPIWATRRDEVDTSLGEEIFT